MVALPYQAILRAYVTRNGNNDYTAETVTNVKLGTFPTAGAAQRAVDRVVGVHLKWTQLASNISTEAWQGTEFVVNTSPLPH